MSLKNLAIWRRAAEMAEATPEDRNRYVDFLRAFSIAAVVFGHWLIAAPSFQNGQAHMDHLLSLMPWSQWTTWFFQVMPIFFFVGGYSNGVSWDSAQRKGIAYAEWSEARLRRLLGPAIPLVLLWAVLGVIGHSFGVPREMIKIGSQVSLVPVWFLAIYFIIVLLVPISRKLWHQFGWLSVAVPVALAVGGDWIFFNGENKWIPWFNYLFLWGAVHQIGYAWQQGKLPSPTMCFVIAIVSIASLVAMTVYGPYPLSLVGHPEQAISNTSPPKMPLLALGVFQIGLFMAFEKPMRRWLAKRRVWTSTVLVNGLIMPIFLWHSTVMMLIIGACFWLMPQLLATEIGTGFWWFLRLVWIDVYLIVLLVALPLFLWLERMVSAQPKGKSFVVIVIPAGMLVCAGLALLAPGGVPGDGPFGLNWLALGLPAAGVFVLSGIGRLLR